MASTIPSKCAVLVVGGGPGGSFTAAVLAREGIDTVILEADLHPRYHVGESMLPSLRHFMRFIGLEDGIAEHGFHRKNGAVFKLNQMKREGYTDFIAAGGPNNYTWNVVRSELDEMIFRHAGKSGAKIFDGVKVTAIEFASTPTVSLQSDDTSSKRPISATYQRKSDGAVGNINFDYIVDASGRAGILGSKYLKSRTYSKALKNIAYWGYWTGAGRYGIGTKRESSPFFEALTDESGWAWFIPLHNGTTSIGVVMNQEAATAQRKAAATKDGAQSLADFYHFALSLTPNLCKILGDGKLVTDIKSASDYSYNSAAYAIPYARMVGDAGCFIDPFFSSGVHLALTGGLSAASTICAAIRGHCTEETAAKWHSQKVSEAYSRFLIVVLSAYHQMRKQEGHILSDLREDNFDRAFDHLRPIIQGTVDVNSTISEEELGQTLDFCAAAFEPTDAAEMNSVLQKIVPNGEITTNDKLRQAADPTPGTLSVEEQHVLSHIRARTAMKIAALPQTDLDNFSTDVFLGMRSNLERGNLGLVAVASLG